MTFTVARAPLRVSLFGGGTDRPEFYENYGNGEVLSFAIDKYMHVAINKVDNQALKVSYSKIETVSDLRHLQHDIVREIWNEYDLGMGWELASFADLPTVGTGLGSSSSFTCALVAALSQYYSCFESPRRSASLAAQACDIEMNLCKSPIGKQDQYAAAVGGFNRFTFHKGGSVSRENFGELYLSSRDRDKLESNLMLFYTGITRSTNEVLSAQKVEGPNVSALLMLQDQVAEAARVLAAKDYQRFGELLHEGWKLKSTLPGVVNPIIIDIYEAARKAGAAGGKVLGAGGGGFMLFYVEPEYQDAVREALSHLKQTKFKIDFSGTQLLTTKDT